MQELEIKLFFNFRSPYCYLASKTLFSLVDDFHAKLVWRPLGGWVGRSPPERAKVKMPLVRQDVARWCKRMNIPMNPPPISTDPTRAAAASLYAEAQDKLRPFIIETMDMEWAEGCDIGQTEIIAEIAKRIGLDADSLVAAADDEANHKRLDEIAREAEELSVMGVSTFLIEEQIFWGNDRIDFVREELTERGLARQS